MEKLPLKTLVAPPRPTYALQGTIAMRCRSMLPSLMLLTLTALTIGRALSADAPAGQPPAAPQLSKIAPVDDLARQVDYYIQRTETTLESPDRFDGAAKNALKKDGSTLAVLALCIGLHDEESKLKPAAPALLKASQDLAQATEYDAAQSAFAAVKHAASGQAAAQNGSLQWEKVASLEQLMKQVPRINVALKRGVTEKRFEQFRQQSAAHAATLAAIAQAVMVDTHEVRNPADLDTWYACCVEMRDAAAAAGAAIRDGDHPATSIAMARLAKSCETCHASFRNNN